MNREEHDELIELGVASRATRGGPMGFEDEEATWRYPDGGLSAD